MVRISGQPATAASTTSIGARNSQAERVRWRVNCERPAGRTAVVSSVSWASAMVHEDAGGWVPPARQGYQPAPWSLVKLTSSSARLSAAVPSPDKVLCTAVQNWLDASLYLTLVGAEGRGTALRNTSFQRGMIGCSLAMSASS